MLMGYMPIKCVVNPGKAVATAYDIEPGIFTEPSRESLIQDGYLEALYTLQQSVTNMKQAKCGNAHMWTCNINNDRSY